jgi:hypothetical protein
LIGRTLAHYRITAALGAGRMGEVYRATDTKLGREIAIKVLPAEMAASPERLERFRREAKALATLDHPGIVTVSSIEEADAVHFLTMQLVEGQPLDRVIPEGDGLPVDRLLEIGTSPSNGRSCPPSWTRSCSAASRRACTSACRPPASCAKRSAPCGGRSRRASSPPPSAPRRPRPPAPGRA